MVRKLLVVRAALTFAWVIGVVVGCLLFSPARADALAGAGFGLAVVEIVWASLVLFLATGAFGEVT